MAACDADRDPSLLLIQPTRQVPLACRSLARALKHRVGGMPARVPEQEQEPQSAGLTTPLPPEMLCRCQHHELHMKRKQGQEAVVASEANDPRFRPSVGLQLPPHFKTAGLGWLGAKDTLLLGSSHWGSQNQWPRQQPHLRQGGSAGQGPYLCCLSPGRGWHSLLLLLSVEQEAHSHCLPPWVSFLVISTSKHQLYNISYSCKHHCSPPLLFFLSLGTAD